MTVIAVLSQKGGVGKTSVCLGLAEAARRHGWRTLVVDLDPQANATEALLHHEPGLTVNDVLADGRPGIAEHAVVPSTWGDGLDVLPSEQALEHRNRDGAGSAAGAPGGSAKRLRVALGDLRSRYDVVLIDCPPSIGELTVNALTAADRAVTVTEPGFFALRGAEQSLTTITVVRDATNLSLRTAGIIVNRFRTNLREHHQRLAELREAYPGLLLRPVLPERSVVAQAHGAGVAVQTLRGKQAAELADAYDSLMRAVTGLRAPAQEEPR
jgi:cellulose biosynthesis protein BcsQ